MHYKDGQEAKLGDVAKFKTYHYSFADGASREVEKVGVLVSVTPGTNACNGNVAHPIAHPIAQGHGSSLVVTLQTATVTLGECELVARA